MGQSQVKPDDATRQLLLETARVMVLRGDNKFSMGTLCTEAGVDRAAFRAHFAGKTALLAAMMQDRPAAAPAPAAEPEPVSKADVTSELSVPAPDAWLERRLRVFERALNALETKADTTAREQGRAIAQLEERLAAFAPAPASAPASVLGRMEQPAAAPVQAAAPAAQPPSPPPLPGGQPAPLLMPAEEQAEGEKKPAAELLAITPATAMTISREEMADVLQTMRDKVRGATAEPEAPPPERNIRARLLAIGGLALLVMFVGLGLTLGKNLLGGTAVARESDGVAHRHVAASGLARTVAMADAGDARAQVALAMAYLRGKGVTSDPVTALRWSAVAAQAGQPVAQYLLGAMYQQGNQVKADPVRAFAWFSASAAKGNLKAMHNLGIAYAQGLGTMKDDAKAAEWFTRAAERGYVDSAFDLAVLYERGEGVPQDLRQALKWYGIAAMAGDAPSKERAEALRGQLSLADAKLAANAAMAFAPLPALGEANSL